MIIASPPACSRPRRAKSAQRCRSSGPNGGQPIVSGARAPRRRGKAGAGCRARARAPRQERIGLGVVRLRLRRDPGQRPQVDVVGREAARPFAPRARDLGGLDARLHQHRDASVMRSWKSKTSSSAPSKLCGPELRARDAVDELRGDAEPVARPPHAAFEQVADAELPRYLAGVDAAPLVAEGRAARDHGEAAEAAERGDDVLHDAVGEPGLPRLAAEIGERQHRQAREGRRARAGARHTRR